MDDRDPNNQTLSLEQLVQNINNIAQILGRLTADIENGTGLLWQPLNSLLTSISALSATLTTNNLIMGSGLGTVAAKTLSEVMDANFGGAQGEIIQRGASVWDNFAVGTSGQFLKTQGDGSNVIWADAFVKVVLQSFTASGTYTPTTGMMFSLLESTGGGGGAGGVASSTNMGGGGGGGGGSTSIALKTAAQVGGSQTVTIGASAAGGSAGNNNGTAGNDTSIGSLCVGKGGSFGAGAAANSNGAGGAGGVSGTGDISIVGQAGKDGSGATVSTTNSPGSDGGSAGLGFGHGGRGKDLSNGPAGSNYGGGGAGGSDRGAGGNRSGGAGAQGVALALDFCKV